MKHLLPLTLLSVALVACAPAIPTAPPAGIGATVIAADAAMAQAATAQAWMNAATAEAQATADSLSVQATQQVLSVQATQQALELVQLQAAATATAESYATAQALGVQQTAVAIDAARLNVAATATAQAHIAARRAAEQETWNLVRAGVVVVSFVLTVVLAVWGAGQVINYVTNLVNLRIDKRRALAEIEIRRATLKALVDARIIDPRGNIYLPDEDGTFLALGAPRLQVNPEYTAAMAARRTVPVNVGGEQVGTIDIDQRPAPVEASTQLTDDEKDMLSMLRASERALGGNHPYVAGSRSIRQPWRDRNGRRQELVNVLKALELVETAEGRPADGRLSNIWLRPGCGYDTVDDLISALSTGLLRLPINATVNAPERNDRNVTPDLEHFYTTLGGAQ